MLQKVEKVHNFLDPPLQANTDYFELGKKLIFDDLPPPSDLNWEKFKMQTIFRSSYIHMKIQTHPLISKQTFSTFCEIFLGGSSPKQVRLIRKANQVRIIINQVGLVTVSAKFQLPSMSRMVEKFVLELVVGRTRDYYV